jgi:hypothetical protein
MDVLWHMQEMSSTEGTLEGVHVHRICASAGCSCSLGVITRRRKPKT